jgi:hypothetical protein
MDRLNSIYKVCITTKKNTIAKMIVFYGETDKTSDELNELLKTNESDPVFMNPSTNNPIFSEEELLSIKRDNTEIFFSKEQIHMDDTIYNVKIKIVKAMEYQISTDEIYLFCIKKDEHTPSEFYKSLSQNKRTQITNARLQNALNNFKSDNHVFTNYEDISNENKKDVYTYDDIAKLSIFNKSINTVSMVGQRLFLMNNQFPFSFNPFDNLLYDKFLLSASSNATTTMNNNLLLDTGIIHNNTIYTCFAQDVLRNVEKIDTQITDVYLLTIYFPLLKSQGVSNNQELTNIKDKLIENTKQIITNNLTNTFEKESIFHKVDKLNINSENTFQYENIGVSEIKLVLHQKFSLKIPLDIIFKLIHTDSNIPLTKMNPAGHRENMYRLFTNDVSTDGRKIPLLPKQTIMQLMTQMGTSKSVSLFFNISKDTFLTSNFEENGDIVIYGKFSQGLLIEDLDKLICQYVNPVIKIIEPFFIQSGYNYNNYVSIYNTNVEVLHMQYVYNINTNNEIPSFDKIKSCITPVFIIESTKIKSKTGARMRYRKVSNFNKMTSKEAFVIEQLKRHDGYQGSELKESIMLNYNMTENDTSELIARIGAELTMDTGIGIRTNRIRINPGFITLFSDTTVKGLRSTNKMKITISGIDNIMYIKMINVYINSILKLLFNNEEVVSIYPEITNICSLKQQKELQIDDVIGAPDKNIMEQQNLIIEDDEVKLETDLQPITYDDNQDTPAPNALSLLYGDDDDDEDYNSEDDINIMMEGGQNDRDIIGMRIKKPTPFMSAMENTEPELFLKSKDGKFESYSRNCDSAYGRQPVLLTQNEYSEIVQQERRGIIERYGEDKFYSLSPTEQENVLERETETDDRYTVSYGTNPDKQYVYICPRYWCLKTNTFINPKEMTTVIEDGKEILRHPTCGGIIPRGQTVVKDDGNYVYEFTGDSRKGRDGKYAPNHPGFLDSNKHPKGYCVPCCFKLNLKNGKVLLSDKQNQRRNECFISSEEKDPADINENTATNPEPKRVDDIYIMDQNTFPIPKGRWGYLPVEIQNFLKERSITYQLANLPTQIKPNTLSILRHGIEESINQSFLACITDIMFYTTNQIHTSITDFKKYLVSVLTLEIFVGLQNGNLIPNFFDRTISMNNIDIDSFKTSPLYNETKQLEFKMIVSSFNNFKKYLLSDNEKIDHTYIWDLVCIPNIHTSHPDGFNLIILEIPESDSTNNINILCPTNHYSSQMFSPTKPSVLIIKKNNDYEPIYSYKKTEQGIKKQCFFHFEPLEKPVIEQEMNPSAIIDTIDTIIKPLYNKKCSPLRLMKNTYKFQSPILLDKLIEYLSTDKLDIKIKNYVLNYSYKVIGLTININDIQGYIPCYPSGIKKNNSSAKYVFMDHESIYQNYSSTIYFINLIINHFGSSIPIKPAFKVVDSEMVVGLITITDQFIMLSQPIELSNTNDDIPVLRHSDYVNTKNGKNSYIDTTIHEITSIDTERINYVNKIKLETNFFTAYRNTIRILLNDYSNLSLRNDIEEHLTNTFMLYSKKLEIIVSLLRQLVGNAIRFEENMDTNVIKDVSVCINNTSQQCIDNNPVCITEKNQEGNDSCTLVIPRTNLVSPGVDNEIVYINKLADQLIRFTRIRSYMFDTTQFLSFGDAQYQLRDNEVVLLQSILKNEYFSNLEIQSNKIKTNNNNYDEINPDSYYNVKNDNVIKYKDISKIPQTENKRPIVKKIKKLKIKGVLSSEEDA